MPVLLLVEDDSTNYELLSDHLAASGFAVHGASDGHEALELAKRISPDVVITDYDLPGLNGCELARAMRRDRGTSRCRVILLTGHVEHRIREAARNAGCDSFLLKPIHLDELVREVRRVFDQPQRILIVEDEPDARNTLCDALAVQGYVAATASNGLEALDWLRAHDPPDAVLLDLTMPVMDGWQFLEEKKRDARLATIPVIVITASLDAPKRLATEIVLPKPVALGRLLGVLRP
jgi:CheY-like chemotaxis protein